ncbi:interleukin-21 [Carassius carassius]|uniref:interleukin-21 n=1 Tax=Carassius carassius TaxID=217509 RepID=UPI002868DF36|nr:interleukin-21 [Carassius carassius]
MKASVCIVFAVVCWIAAQAEESPMILTLSKVMNELNRINKDMVKDKSTSLNSPTIYDLKDCCVAPALECFRSQVLNLKVEGKLKRSQKIIFNELRKSFMVKGVSSCKPEEIQTSQCKSCDSYNKVDSQMFVQSFQTLLQKIYATQA